MTTTTKSLRLNFKNAKDESTSITLANALENLPADKVKDAMQKIAGSNVFKKDGTVLYVTPVSANYIERTVTPVFEDEAEAKDAE